VFVIGLVAAAATGVASHNMPEVLEVADRVEVLRPSTWSAP
jgi:ABC-type sugar transport system ATPase subunit